MTKLQIFTDRNKLIDLATFIDSRALICANSGGGKSYAIRKILEESHDKVMSIVLDVEGEFKTLREKFDFLLIGHGGDVALNLQSASLLPQKLLELNVSTIVDISELKRHERIIYVKKFLESLMELPRAYWKPCLVVLDEIHQLAGQQEKQDSTYSVIDVATRGRKRGYCLVGCTQRISKLHKDVVAELNNYMVGRTGLDIDQKRAGEILGFTNKQEVLSLRDLDAGEFYIFGTAISKYVRKLRIAPVKTTHPKVGMKLDVKLSQPTPKIKSMLAKLGDLPKDAEKKFNEIKDYKKEISRLTIELSRKPSLPIDDKRTDSVRNDAFNRGLKAEASNHKSQISFYEKRERIFETRINSVINELKQFTMKCSKTLQFDLPKIPESKSIHVYTKESVPLAERYVDLPNPHQVEAGDEKLKTGALRMLKAIAMFTELSREKTKTLAGLSNPSTFSTYIQDLKRAGFISENNRILKINPEGINAVGDVQVLPTDTESLISLWSKFLKSGAIRMLRIAVERHPNSMTRTELQEESGIINPSTFSTYVQDLKRNGLIKLEGIEVTASEELFE